LTSAHDGKLMADQAAIVVEMINRFYPEFKQTPQGDPDLHIPVV